MPRRRVLAVRGLALSAMLAPVLCATEARATEPASDIGVLPPSQPQPYPQQAPPQQYPQYAQQPAYQPYPQPQPYPYPARPRSWRDGDPVPVGYHVEEKPRSGLVTAGLVMVLVPYAIGAFAGIAAKFGNESTWLVAPVLGPWLTIGQRRYYSCDKSNTNDSLGCAADVLVVTGLVISGVVQAAGGTLFLVGLLNPKPTLVRDDSALRVRPMTIGSGYGVGLESGF